MLCIKPAVNASALEAAVRLEHTSVPALLKLADGPFFRPAAVGIAGFFDQGRIVPSGTVAAVVATGTVSSGIW